MRKPIVKTDDRRQRTSHTATGVLFAKVQRKKEWSQKQLAEELGETAVEISKYATGKPFWSGKGRNRKQLKSKPRPATAVEWDKRHAEFGLAPHAFFAATCETLGEELTGKLLSVAVNGLVPLARSSPLATSVESDGAGGNALPSSLAKLVRDWDEYASIETEGAAIEYRFAVFDCRLGNLGRVAKATRGRLQTLSRKEFSAALRYIDTEDAVLKGEVDLINDSLRKHAQRVAAFAKKLQST